MIKKIMLFLAVAIVYAVQTVVGVVVDIPVQKDISGSQNSAVEAKAIGSVETVKEVVMNGEVDVDWLFAQYPMFRTVWLGMLKTNPQLSEIDKKVFCSTVWILIKQVKTHYKAWLIIGITLSVAAIIITFAVVLVAFLIVLACFNKLGDERNKTEVWIGKQQNKWDKEKKEIEGAQKINVQKLDEQNLKLKKEKEDFEEKLKQFKKDKELFDQNTILVASKNNLQSLTIERLQRELVEKDKLIKEKK